MKVLLAGAAVAAFSIALGGAASATICTNACDHDYTICNNSNGANAQQVCMPKWMQCKKTCATPAKPTLMTKPKR